LTVLSQIYDPSTGKWGNVAPAGEARGSHSAVLLPDGRVLVAGGLVAHGGAQFSTDSAEIYDPTTNRWTPASPMASSRANHRLLLLPTGQVLAPGGQNVVDDVFVPLAACELFDPASGTWSATGNLLVRRATATAVSLPDGRVLTAGGQVASAEIYQP
jgi:hypothetical protein